MDLFNNNNDDEIIKCPTKRLIPKPTRLLTAFFNRLCPNRRHAKNSFFYWSSSTNVKYGKIF